MYCLISLFSFSMAPFCQDAYESAKYTVVPSAFAIFLWQANSLPLSVVMVSTFFRHFGLPGNFDMAPVFQFMAAMAAEFPAFIAPYPFVYRFMGYIFRFHGKVTGDLLGRPVFRL